MANLEVEEKVSILEMVLADHIAITTRSQLRVDRELERLSKEMREFKEEMGGFKNESRKEMKEMNKQWGALANKMGTLVEDIIAPSVRPVMSKYFGEEIEYIAVNVRKNDKLQNLKGEFDVIATSPSFVFLIETKSRPQKEHLEEFISRAIPRFQALFPEFAQKQFIPVFASLRFEDSITEIANSKKIYLLAFREWEYMDILNFDAVSPSLPA
ncbi:MAG: hypothetical protein ACKVUS_01440 [Saprospiraceae bacterium]